MTDDAPLAEQTEPDIEADETAISTASPEAAEVETSAGASESGQVQPRRTRTPRTYPASSFMEALPLGAAIQKYAAGNRVRRLTLFEQLGRSAESSQSRQLVTNSTQYGITKGSYRAEFLELTDNGRLATGDATLGRQRVAARLQLAIEGIEPFRALYEQFKNNRAPAVSVMRDFVIEQDLASADNADECVETFLANTRDLGLLAMYAGAERFLTFEIVLDEVADSDQAPSEVAGEKMSPTQATPVLTATPRIHAGAVSPAQVLADSSDLSRTCFFVTPIGSPGSPERQHADLMLGSLVEPAIQALGLRIVRADKISAPGMITGQVIEHLVRSPLVIADLSFGNPNVFYELALRHASRKPAVQIIRSGDHLPFDVGQFRTVTLDMSSIFTLVPQIEAYRSEIARQCRAAMEEGGVSESPLSLFYPRFWEQFSGR